MARQTPTGGDQSAQTRDNQEDASHGSLAGAPLRPTPTMPVVAGCNELLDLLGFILCERCSSREIRLPCGDMRYVIWPLSPHRKTSLSKSSPIDSLRPTHLRSRSEVIMRSNISGKSRTGR